MQDDGSGDVNSHPSQVELAACWEAELAAAEEEDAWNDSSESWVPPIKADLVRAVRNTSLRRLYPWASWLASRSFRELQVVGGLIATLVADIAGRHGLTHAAVNALAVIEGNGGPLPAGEVASRMHVTSGTATTVLDTLDRNGYVIRLADPTDRRRVLVEITPAAGAVLDAVLPEIQQAASAVMGRFGDEPLKALLATLTEVREAMAAMPADLPNPAPRRKPPRLRRT